MSRPRYPLGRTPVTRVRRRPVRVMSIRALRWNLRLGVVSQLVYIVGGMPRTLRLAVLVFAGALTLQVVVLVLAFWPWLAAAALALFAYRLTRPRLEQRRQRRRDRDDIPF